MDYEASDNGFDAYDDEENYDGFELQGNTLVPVKSTATGRGIPLSSLVFHLPHENEPDIVPASVMAERSSFESSLVDYNSLHLSIDSKNYPLAMNGTYFMAFLGVGADDNAGFNKHYSQYQLRNASGQKYRGYQGQELSSTDIKYNSAAVAYSALSKTCCGIIKCPNPTSVVELFLIVESIHIPCRQSILQDPDSRKAFQHVVLSNPTKKPSQLAVTLNGAQKIQDIHESYANVGAVAHYRKIALLSLPYSHVESSLFSSLKYLQQIFPNCIVSSSLHSDDMHISAATPWMKDLFVNQIRLSEVDNGNCLSDVTYSFFNDGYLLSSVVYDVISHRWVPVLYTFIYRLDQKHHRAHFKVLIGWAIQELLEKQFMDYDDDLECWVANYPWDQNNPEKKTETLDFWYRQVMLCVGQGVDFSAAQRSAFIAEFVVQMARIRNKLDFPCLSKEELVQMAESVITGCKQHFLSSAKRLQRNHAVVGVHDLDNFTKMAVSLMEAATTAVFDQLSKILLEKYPRARKWFEFFKRSSISKMLFDCFKEQLPEFKAISRLDSNPQESLHNYYYLIAGKNHAVTYGLKMLIAISKHMEDIHFNRKQGIHVTYGKDERWKKIVEVASAPAAKATKQQNDGRAPDTTRLLVPVADVNKTKSNLIDSDLELAPLLLATTAPKLSTIAPPSTSEKQYNESRPFGATTSDRNRTTTFQSFRQHENCCYISGLIEPIISCFLKLNIKSADFTIGDTSKTRSKDRQPFTHLLQHIDERRKTQHSLESKDLVPSKYSKVILCFQNWVLDRNYYKRMEYGNPFLVLQHLLHDIQSDMGHPFQCIFLFKREIHKECSSGHISDHSKQIFDGPCVSKKNNYGGLDVTFGNGITECSTFTLVR
ncbi:hypothetical protein BDR26DRAFT_935326 [Obelidium mucronatum]|nr:hypothetical protein BDR26DRAFT_935326 [Obelidium mucronatum]